MMIVWNYTNAPTQSFIVIVRVIDKSTVILPVMDIYIVFNKKLNNQSCRVIDVDPHMKFWCITFCLLLRGFGINKGILLFVFFAYPFRFLKNAVPTRLDNRGSTV